jgi:hypothetical protein
MTPKQPSLHPVAACLAIIFAASLTLNVGLLLRDEFRRETIRSLSYLEVDELQRRFGTGDNLIPSDLLLRIDHETLSGVGQAGFSTGAFLTIVLFTFCFTALIGYAILESYFRTLSRKAGGETPPP